MICHEPTRHPQAEDLMIGNVKFKTHDLGGHQAARRLWKQYLTGVDGIVFIVDTTEKKRFDEASNELEALLGDDTMSKVPILVLGNKIDAKGACNETELLQALRIENFLTDKNGGAVTDGTRPMQVFMCSVIKRSGYAEGFKWLANYLP